MILQCVAFCAVYKYLSSHLVIYRISHIGVVPPKEAPNAKEDLWTAYWMNG